MVTRRETLRGTAYYLGGLAVTLASPEVPTIPQRIVIFTGYAIAALAIEGTLSLRRGRKEERTTREPQVEVLLEGLLAKHRTDGPDYRTNVMIPFENRPVAGLLSNRFSYRTLEFKDHTGGYSESELQQSYDIGQGCCGLAWAKCRPVVYGEGRKERAEKEMTGEQLGASAAVESMLSVPIYDGERLPDNLVCVVNVDSTAPLSETSFTDRVILQDTERRANFIAATVKEDYHA